MEEKNMHEAKKYKAKQKLIKGGFMSEEDNIIDGFQVNYRENLLGGIGQWQQGWWAYFTEEKMVAIRALANIVIPYKNIRSVGKCRYVFFLPVGISITFEHPESGEEVTEKFYMMKGKKWRQFLADKAGVEIS